jgi:hypothetical protein
MNKYLIILLYVSIILGSCNLRSKDGKAQRDDTLIKENNDVNKENKNIVNTFNFLNDCNKLKKRSWEGSLQGTNKSKDSISYLCFSACYDCQETYELIFVLRGGVERRKHLGYDSIWSTFKNVCNNKFKDFECFVFVIPMKDPEKQDNIHETIYTFPSKIKVYKQVDSDNWRLLCDTLVGDFNAYANLRFKTIYGLN